MKKINLFLLSALAFLACVGLQAQVTIGGLTVPTAGTILDLNSLGGARGGLLLSNVEIPDLGKIPADVLTGINEEQESNPNLRGMMVYNTGTDSVPAGLYIWNGYSWTTDGDYTLTVTPSSTRTFAVSGQADLKVTADGCPSITYTWYKNTVASTTDGQIIDGANAATYHTPANLTEGTYYYYCTIKSDYSGVETVSNLFTVTVCPAPAAPDSIKGFGSFCGTDQTYFVEPVSGITHEWTLNNTNEWSFTYGKTNDTIILTHTTPNAMNDVTISVKAKNNCGEISSNAKTLVVRPGIANAGGAYERIGTGYLTNVSNIDTSFDQILDKDLCFANSDLNDGSTYEWADVVAGCENLGDDWRLPNIAELKNYNQLLSTYYYWSITEASATNAWSCRGGTTPAPSNTSKTPPPTLSITVRCVKTITVN